MWAITSGDLVVQISGIDGNYMAIFSTRSQAREKLKDLKEANSIEMSNKSFKIYKVDVLKAEE